MIEDIIIGIIALIGSLHYPLANDLLRDLGGFGSYFSSICPNTIKDREKIIRNCRDVFIFITFSNHIVELVFSFVVIYALFRIVEQVKYLCFFSIGLFGLFVYIFCRAFSDLKRINKVISRWFKSDCPRLNCFRRVFVILAFIVLFFYFRAVYPLFHHGQTEWLKDFLTLSPIFSFLGWWLSFVLKPLTKMFEIREIIPNEKL